MLSQRDDVINVDLAVMKLRINRNIADEALAGLPVKETGLKCLAITGRQAR